MPPRARRAFRLDIRRPDWTEADVDEEIQLHVEMRVEQLVAQGWTRADAETEARRRFGPSWEEAVQRLWQYGHAREERLTMRERLDLLWNDIRYAARGLIRAPRFAAAALLTLALGLGATTVIFSLVDHVVLRPLPYADPERLVVVRESGEGISDAYPTIPANASHFLEWQRGCRACESLAAIRRLSATMTGQGDAQRLGGVRASVNLFSLLGVRPQLGREFRVDEDSPGNDRVIVLSDGFWRRQFAADPGVIGRTIQLEETPFEIVGVLPSSFSLPSGDALGALVGLPQQIDFYQPLALNPRETRTRGEFDYAVIARLKPGATVAEARAQLDAIGVSIAEQVGAPTPMRSAIVPLQTQVVGAVGRPLLLLLGAVGAVLLIVCANLANLTLARNAGRQRESAVRVALGAGRGRLTRLALAESLTLSVVGGLLGLLLAYWGLGALVAVAPASLPRIASVQLDGRVFAAAALIAVLVGLSVGALPALRMSQVDPGEAMKAGGRTITGSRVAARRRSLFIAAQVAISTVLLVGTGLFLTSFVRVLRVDTGFDGSRVLVLDVALPKARYTSVALIAQFYERALRELSATAGVVSAGVTTALPLQGETQVDILTAEHETRPAEQRPTANIRYVNPDYFSTIGTALRQGRAFAESDRDRPVVIVSKRAAETLWPNENPIGKRLVAGSNDPIAEVVGVAADVRTSSLEREGSLVAYLPYWQQGAPMKVLVRASGDPAALVSPVREALRRADPMVAITRFRAMNEVRSDAVAERRFQLTLLGLFAMMALVTASIGIYGVISQSLASRTGEIGVRMALGARPADVHRLVLGEGLRPVALGLLIGILGSLALGRGFESLLFEVRASDPLTIAGVAALLAAVAVVACAIPARRATATGLSAMLRLE